MIACDILNFPQRRSMKTIGVSTIWCKDGLEKA